MNYLTVPHLHTKHLRRLFSKIRVDKVTGCWLWTASVNSGGYGATSVRTIAGPIHRLMYAWLVEPIPKGIGKDIPQLDHAVCDTRRCVNPAHLKLVSARENNLRGVGMGARWSKRTHCSKGHPLGEAVAQYGETRRRCKTCQKRDARQLALHRAAQLRYTARLKALSVHDSPHLPQE